MRSTRRENERAETPKRPAGEAAEPKRQAPGGRVARDIAGEVLTALPKLLFRVRCEDGKEVVASFGAAARRVMVKVIPGDRVIVRRSPIDPTRATIVGSA